MSDQQPKPPAPPRREATRLFKFLNPELFFKPAQSTQTLLGAGGAAFVLGYVLFLWIDAKERNAKKDQQRK
jgi:hypothetical protein